MFAWSPFFTKLISKETSTTKWCPTADKSFPASWRVTCNYFAMSSINVFIRNFLLFQLLFTQIYIKNCSTMLQNLSKCEVKAWLCWNVIIAQALRFYVKSNFGKFKQSKNIIIGNLRDSNLWILVNLGLESCSNLSKIKIQNLWNCQKWHLLTVWLCQNWISRKIRVMVKWSNFNKVKP